MWVPSHQEAIKIIIVMVQKWGSYQTSFLNEKIARRTSNNSIYMCRWKVHSLHRTHSENSDGTSVWGCLDNNNNDDDNKEGGRRIVRVLEMIPQVYMRSAVNYKLMLYTRLWSDNWSRIYSLVPAMYLFALRDFPTCRRSKMEEFRMCAFYE